MKSKESLLEKEMNSTLVSKAQLHHRLPILFHYSSVRFGKKKERKRKKKKKKKKKGNENRGREWEKILRKVGILVVKKINIFIYLFFS
jgi:hypothetical protein